LVFTLARPSSQGGYEVAGLAIAQSIVAAFEVFMLAVVMAWRDRGIFRGDFWNGLVRTLSVTGFTVLTTYIMVSILPLEATDRGFITLGTKISLIILPTFIVHILLSGLFSLEEAKPVINKIRQIIFKPIKL